MISVGGGGGLKFFLVKLKIEAERTNYAEPVEDKEDGGGPEEGVPEPEGQVDLLVDDVLRQDAQTVVVLEKDADRKDCLSKLASG